MTWDDLESRGQNLRDDIPADHRAFTVEVDSSAAQAGQLRPGDHVDVLGVFADDRGSICKTVLEDVRVLSVGGNRLVAGLVPPFATITLDLTPEECQIMALAVENATISMTLRGTGDRGATKLPPTHLDSLSR